MKRIFVSRPKSVLVTSRHVVKRTFDHTGHVHSFLIFDTPHPLLSEIQPCADLRHPLSGALAEPPSITGYEPKQLAEYQDHQLFTEDEHFSEHQDLAEHQDLRVKPLFFHRPTTTSTYDSAESIVIPSLAYLDDEQIRALLASPRYLPEREASAERSQAYHSERESLMSSSSQGLKSVGTEEPVALFSRHSGLNQDALPEREREQPVDVLGVVNQFSDSPTRQILRNLFLMEIEITCLFKRVLN